MPEINAAAIGSSRLIANPNCTTAIAVMALWPIHYHYGIRRLIVSTYQAASGAGAEVSTHAPASCEEEGKRHETLGSRRKDKDPECWEMDWWFGHGPGM